MLFENIPHPPVDYHPDKLENKDWSLLKNKINDGNDLLQYDAIPVNEKPLGKPYIYEELGQMALKTILPGLETDKPAVLAAPVDSKTLVERQLESEASYDITIETASYGNQLSAAEIVERMEVDHAVKTGPRLYEQVGDATRTNNVIYVPSKMSIGTSTSYSQYVSRRIALTEEQVIDRTNDYLETAIACGSTLGDEHLAQARSIRDNLTFIGEKEYKEATVGIALYWKALLERNPDLQLLALGDAITKSGSEKMVKSDEYLLDAILTHFTDEEMEKYGGRLITDQAEITVTEARDLKIVLLDDWTISGSQLSGVVMDLYKTHPQFASSIELQLVAANNERITRGFKRIRYDSSRGKELTIPVRAYFKAHHAPKATKSKAHITGAHSSVDYDFEVKLDHIAETARRASLSTIQHATLDIMPPMTNIVRPYRLEEVQLTQKDRLKSRSNEGRRNVS